MIKAKAYTIPVRIDPGPNECNVTVPLFPAGRQFQHREQGMGGLNITYVK
jgi:hypothetical protein